MAQFGSRRLEIRAVCDACQKWVLWEAKGGARLKDLRCPRCSGVLRAFSRGKDIYVTNAAYSPDGTYDARKAWAIEGGGMS